MNNDIKKVYAYLKTQYAGVFSEKQIHRHVKDYIGLEIANKQVKQVKQKTNHGARILDIGSGFGSFVLAARKQGLDAIGIELSEFEVKFARKLLKSEIPEDKPESVYYYGDALELPFDDESFDVVTMWNVLEHVHEYKKLLSKAVRVLRPKGYMYIVCPNYAAFREEAHYHIPWLPLLPEKQAIMYLKLMNKNPRFFQKNIFYRTNWGVLYALKKCGVQVIDERDEKIYKLELVNNKKIKSIFIMCKKMRILWIVRFILKMSFYNPFKKSIVLYARKMKR